MQVGIVSFGPDFDTTGEGCGSRLFPDVYTRVSSVANWVRTTVCSRVGELCDNNQPTGPPNNRPTNRPTTRVTVGSKAGKATARPIQTKSGKVGNDAKRRKD